MSELTAEEFKKNVNVRPYFENSYGYAVFESIRTTEEKQFVSDAAWVVGGAYGEGAVYINPSKTVDGIADNVQTGTSKMLQATKGTAYGLKTPYPMIIFFLTQWTYEKFATVGFHTIEFGSGNWLMTLPASVIPGMRRKIDQLPTRYTKGVAVVAPSQMGTHMYEYPIAGQTYSFAPIGN